MPYCSNCGTENSSDTRFCNNCGANMASGSSSPPPPPPGQYGGYSGASGGGGTYAPNVPDYLVQSILVTIFCCLPFGIAAIVFAAQANSKKGAGDFGGALESANKAKTFCWIAAGIGLVVGVLYLIFVVALAGSSTTSDTGF